MTNYEGMTSPAHSFNIRKDYRKEVFSGKCVISKGHICLNHFFIQENVYTKPGQLSFFQIIAGIHTQTNYKYTIQVITYT